jgi:hypothetical protein
LASIGRAELKLHFVDDAEVKGGKTAFDRLCVSFLTTAGKRYK